MAKRVKWVCPECGAAKLGSTRPRANNVVRFCLPCSERTGFLVERTAPALAKKRTAKAERAAAKRKAAAERQAEQARAKVTVAGIDFQAELEQLWALPCNPRRNRPVPELVIRRCARQPASRIGFASYRYRRISVSVWPGQQVAQALDTLAHEVAHLAGQRNHDRPFAEQFEVLVRTHWGLTSTLDALAGPTPGNKHRKAWRRVARATIGELSRRPEYSGRVPVDDVPAARRQKKAARTVDLDGTLTLTKWQWNELDHALCIQQDDRTDAWRAVYGDADGNPLQDWAETKTRIRPPDGPAWALLIDAIEGIIPQSPAADRAHTRLLEAARRNGWLLHPEIEPVHGARSWTGHSHRFAKGADMPWSQVSGRALDGWTATVWGGSVLVPGRMSWTRDEAKREVLVSGTTEEVARAAVSTWLATRRVDSETTE